MNTVVASRDERRVRQNALYMSLPAGAISFLSAGPVWVMQGIYAKYYGLSLTAIASILLIANLFDTITDPLIGYFSDGCQTRFGTRKPFIVTGAALFIFSAYFLFVPPENVSASYFLCWFLLFYLGLTLFVIPHQAWASEISTDSKSSTRIYSSLSLMMYVGALLFYALPQLPLFETTEFTPETLKWAVALAAVLLIPSIYLCLRHVPSGQNSICQTNKPLQNGLGVSKKGSTFSLLATKNLLCAITKNKPLLLFLGAFLFFGAGFGIWSSVLFIYVDAYLNMGDQYSFATMVGLSVAAVAVRFWALLALKIGKIKSWALGTVLVSGSILCMVFLNPQSASSVWLVIVMVFVHFSAAATMVCAPALLADIADYGQWKFGKNHTGSYFAVYSLVTKCNGAIGGAMGLALAGWYGFDPGALSHPVETIFGLQLAAIWLPPFFLLLAFVFVLLIPVDAKRHAVICKALLRREKNSIPENYFSPADFNKDKTIQSESSLEVHSSDIKI